MITVNLESQYTRAPPSRLPAKVESQSNRWSGGGGKEDFKLNAERRQND